MTNTELLKALAPSKGDWDLKDFSYIRHKYLKSKDGVTMCCPLNFLCGGIHYNFDSLKFEEILNLTPRQACYFMMAADATPGYGIKLREQLIETLF
jgi:hypothetical protein